MTRFPVGTRRTLGGHNLGTLVFETGRPARVDHYAESSSGALGDVVREAAVRSAVGTPIVVDGRLWGLIAAGSSLEQPLPADTETRLASFTELVATAIANTEGRAALARLAEEQAALRRVATLVAQATAAAGVRGGRRGGRRAAGGRLRDPGPVRPAGHDQVVGTWTADRRPGADPGRRPAAARRPERDHAEV